MLAPHAGQAFSAPTAVVAGGGADGGDQVIAIEVLDQDGVGAGGKRGGGKGAMWRAGALSRLQHRVAEDTHGVLELASSTGRRGTGSLW